MNEQHTSIEEQELHAYVDGTLPDERREFVARRIEGDPALRARADDYRWLNGLLHDRYDAVLDKPVPVRLQVGSWRTGFAATWTRYGAMAAMLLLGAGIGVTADMAFRLSSTADLASVRQSTLADNSDTFAHDSAIAHVTYVPEDSHPYEIDADQERAMARFLATKLDTTEHPPILTRAGFELMGGRLFPGSSGRIVQYTYQGARGERVTLCISNPKGHVRASGFRLYRDGPVNVLHWIDGNLRYAVSGGIDEVRLTELAREVQTQLAASPAASEAYVAPAVSD
jgi:anti-sigma factor RsiW